MMMGKGAPCSVVLQGEPNVTRSATPLPVALAAPTWNLTVPSTCPLGGIELGTLYGEHVVMLPLLTQVLPVMDMGNSSPLVRRQFLKCGPLNSKT
jgi:hypothetical protein